MVLIEIIIWKLFLYLLKQSYCEIKCIWLCDAFKCGKKQKSQNTVVLLVSLVIKHWPVCILECLMVAINIPIRNLCFLKKPLAQFSKSTLSSMSCSRRFACECAICLNCHDTSRVGMFHIPLLSSEKNSRALHFYSETLFWLISNIVFIEKVRSTVLFLHHKIKHPVFLALFFASFVSLNGVFSTRGK